MLDPSTILVAGGEGRLGRALRQLGCNAQARNALNITDGQMLARRLDAVRPALVINAAAYTAVDAAESDELAAIALNRNGAWALAHRCAYFGIPLIHLSTDCVFGDAAADAPVDEAVPTAPLSVYGRTKADGEAKVLDAHDQACVVRVSWLFDDSAESFVGKILRAAGQRKELSIVADEWGRPTPVADLATTLLRLAGMIVSGKKAPRLLHLGPRRPVNRFEWAQEIFEASQQMGGPYPKLTAISAADFVTPARRPRGLVLDVTRAQTLLGAMPDWRAANSNAVRANLAAMTA